MEIVPADPDQATALRDLHVLTWEVTYGIGRSLLTASVDRRAQIRAHPAVLLRAFELR